MRAQMKLPFLRMGNMLQMCVDGEERAERRALMSPDSEAMTATAIGKWAG